MVSKDLQLFNLVDKITHEKFKRFKKFYENDSKKFLNKIDRDYKKTKNFPAHVLKQIKQIDKQKYDSAVCILRGALPYALLFEADGWKIHYVICGRINEQIVRDKNKLRFNKSIDKTLSQITGKKILLIENNSFSGNTPYRTTLELKKTFNIKKPDLFLDYFCKNNVFETNQKRMNAFGKFFVASKLKVSKKEKDKLVQEFLDKLPPLSNQ
ncbi:MAG: hypothetical protein ACOCP4_06255 [Candidatus Woesearchaeota archaeon]